MSDSNKAVFLSYASQDAEAAKRICEALRAAGIEVWFDQSELVGGDAWDQKIRGQIGSCGLFVPLVSANTQARLEGYFRREWKQAAARTQDMADEKAFLLPVVIDGTRDAEAKVPAEFKTVQWTKLPAGETPPAFVARVKKLLSDGGSSSRETGSGTASRELGPPREKRRGPGRWWWALPIFGVTMALMLVLKEGRKDPVPSVVSPPASAAAPVSETDQLVRQARELIYDPDSARSEFALAANLLKRATELAPASAPAWGASALLNHYFFSRTYDTDRQRLVRSQAEADQALKLDPRNTDALLAHGLHRQELGEIDRARDYFERARDSDPQNFKVILAQGYQLPDPRARAKYLLDAAATVARPAELYYYAGVNLRFAAQYEAARGALEQAIAAQPFWRTYVGRADIEYMLTADPAKIDAWLDRVPEAKRDEPRVAYMRYNTARLRRDGAGMLRALRGLAVDFLQDNFFVGPKAYLLAEAHTYAGQPAQALEQWQVAERSVRERLAAEPGVISWRAMLAVILAGQNRKAEAKAAADSCAADERLGQSQDLRGMGVLTAEVVAHAYMAVGEPGQALAVLRRPRLALYTGDVSAASLAVDPAYDSLRGLPEYALLLAELKRAESGGDAAGTTVAFKVGDSSFAKASTAAKAMVDRTEDGLGLASPPNPKSVAVLAFANLSDDKANEYFSDGISEELLNVLAKIPGLKVSARTSAFYFKGKQVPMAEIAQQLGVAYVVEGSVRKQGDKVRITAQLIKAADGFHVWSDTFTRDLKDVFAVQDEIAGLIAGNLQAMLEAPSAMPRAASIGPRAASAPPRLPDVETHQLYLQGKYFLNQFSVENAHRAVELLQSVVQREPHFAPAWAAMARAGLLLIGYASTPAEVEEGRALARRSAARALAEAPDLVEAHLVLVRLQLDDFDWAGATAALRRVTALAPGDPGVVQMNGKVAYAFGQRERARQFAAQAVALDPVNAEVVADHGFALHALQRFDEAMVAFRRVAEISATAPWGHSGVSLSLSAQRRFDEAAREAALEANEWSRLFALAIAQWGQGLAADADATVARLSDRYGDVAAYQLAGIYAARGDKEQAFSWLERAYRQKDPGLAWLRSDYEFERLYADPRWAAFLRKLGLADGPLK